MSINYASQIVSPKEKKTTTTVKNNAGGDSYKIDSWGQLERFLILGTESGSYYVGQKAMTIENVKSLDACLKSNPQKVVDTIVAISDQGRAAKNAPAVFALAYCAAFTKGKDKVYALRNMPLVARSSTDMFAFVDQYKRLGGGFGATMRKAIANWYKSKSIEGVGTQLVKYRQRNGWTHHDIISLGHVKPSDNTESNMYAFAKALDTKDYSKVNVQLLPNVVKGYLHLSESTNPKSAAKLIADYGLPWECVPTELLSSPEVWDALLPKMGATALIRNLGKMSSIGLLKPLSQAEKMVSEKLTNSEWLKNSRIHPITVLNASKIYTSGRGVLGNLTWTPSNKVKDALSNAFYGTFQNVVPSGKNIYIGLDISGSMFGARVLGFDALTAAEVAAAMSLVTYATEPNVYVRAFCTNLTDVKISKGMTLEQLMLETRRLSSYMGGTDCGLPMRDAMRRKLDVDGFMVITDNETWAGTTTPAQCLRDYRKSSGKFAKLAVLATSASNFSIADPTDRGMLDIAGFDSAAPAIVSNFFAG